MVIVCELARSAGFPAQLVLAPWSISAEILKVAVIAVFGLVFTSVTGRVIVRLELVAVSTSTPLDEKLNLQGPIPVKVACTVLVCPLHTAAGPSRVTVEVGRGLIVMVCELAR